MKNNRRIILTLLFVNVFIGCESTDPIQTKSFPEKNLPEHNFKFNSNALRDTIISLFTVARQYNNSVLARTFYSTADPGMSISFGAETSKDTIFSKQYFSKAGTTNDIFLHSFAQAWDSKYYYSKNRPLIFISNYIIKFERLNDSITKVSIMADDPEVINGTTCCGPHGTEARYTPVESSTIEEYTLLEYIASKLDDTSLAPIKLPKG
jgi:hypothetical protein